MRVLSLYYTHKEGGFCKRLYRLLNALSARGHEVVFLSLDQPHASLSTSVSFKRIPFPLKRRSSLLFWFLFIFWVPFVACYSVAKIKPNKVVVFSPFYSAIFFIARIFTSVPIILFVRSRLIKKGEAGYYNFFISNISAGFDRLGLLLASRVVCMTRSMAEDVSALCSKDKIKILPNDVVFREKGPISGAFLACVPQELKSKLNSKTLKIVSVGRFDQKKNTQFIVDAMAQAKSANCFLLLLGDGPLREKIESHIKSLGLSNVHCAGWVKNPADILSDANLFVHPSLHEGMPNALLEAMGNRVAVLVSKIPELIEIVESSELAFDASDPSDLAKRIVALCADHCFLERLRNLSLSAGQKYAINWDDLAENCVASEL